MNVLERIKELNEQRGWTINHLAKVSDVPQSTLSGLFIRNNNPTISTLENICKAFGITMSEFFLEEGGLASLTEDQRRLLDKWNALSIEKKEAVLTIIDKI